MDAIIKPIEKMKPFFDKVARNKYLKAIKDGFISSMPIILFSSIFLVLETSFILFNSSLCFFLF